MQIITGIVNAPVLAKSYAHTTIADHEPLTYMISFRDWNTP